MTEVVPGVPPAGTAHPQAPEFTVAKEEHRWGTRE